MSSRDLLDLIWIVPALPLFGAVVPAALRQASPGADRGWIATSLVMLSFAWSLVMFFAMLDLPHEVRVNIVTLYTWLPAGTLHVDMGFYADTLSVTWILLVTGVGSLIHLYSIGYMHGDERFSRFFAYLNLFVFSMLMLVLGSSFLVTFLGWEGVGLCSYLLVSFWFERNAAAVAGKKAFVTNRVGDVGFLLAMFLIFASYGSLNYAAMAPGAHAIVERHGHRHRAAAPRRGGGQERADPAPHLAARRDGGPDPGVGADPRRHHGHRRRVPPLPCARVPRREHRRDDRRRLGRRHHRAPCRHGRDRRSPTSSACSPTRRSASSATCSSRVGIGAYSAAVFMVICHAFYKGCLFLGAGSVIHGNGDNQDMRIMGRFRKFMPSPRVAMVIAWLAIAGVPPLSGFFSKDEIISQRVPARRLRPVGRSGIDRGGVHRRST